MKCIERVTIEEFVKGKLAPQQMLEVDSHIRECADCRKLATSLSTRVDLAAAVTGAVECPEYEELSAYADGTLDGAASAYIHGHVNMCELCSRDLNRIGELRSHASLRETVTIRLDSAQPSRRGVFFYWRQALAVASAAGLIAVAVIYGNFGGTTSKTHNLTVQNPPIAQPKHATPTAPPKPEPQVVAKNDPVVTPPAASPKPAPMVTPPAVLKDGQYSVVRKDGNLVLAKADGTAVGSRLDSRMAARITEKLRTGTIRLPEPLKVAMSTFTMRADTEEYHPQPAAPKPVGPIGRVVMTAYPVFKWSAVDLADSYRVQVYDDSGNLLTEQITKETYLKLSSPLPRDRTYRWRVAVRFGEQDSSWVRSAVSAFYVLSEQDYNAINKARGSLGGSHLAMGAAYESVGLYEEAANEYRLLLRRNPNSKLARDLLQGTAGH